MEKASLWEIILLFLVLGGILFFYTQGKQARLKEEDKEEKKKAVEREKLAKKGHKEWLSRQNKKIRKDHEKLLKKLEDKD